MQREPTAVPSSGQNKCRDGDGPKASRTSQNGVLGGSTDVAVHPPDRTKMQSK